MDNSTFKESFSELFREAFEGVREGESGTWFVQGKESLFDALSALDASQASRHPSPGVATVAAHLGHTTYYLEVANQFARGEKPDLDWEGSWSQQAVDPEEWAALGRRLRSAYDEMQVHVEQAKLTEADEVTAIMANLAHAAFHLGAVRQLMKLVV